MDSYVRGLSLFLSRRALGAPSLLRADTSCLGSPSASGEQWSFWKSQRGSIIRWMQDRTGHCNRALSRTSFNFIARTCDSRWPLALGAGTVPASWIPGAAFQSTHIAQHALHCTSFLPNTRLVSKVHRHSSNHCHWDE